MIGRQIGHYRIVEQIGRGGMGVVYLAEDARLGRRVALKVLPPEMAGDPTRRARFEREARAVAALNHPNIVTIHSVEEIDGTSFLTMELVRGRSLGEMLPPEGLPLPKLIDWSLAIADALVAAHKTGVVHRDLKPDNIMVTQEGRLKVLDFGLAKLRESVLENAGTALPPTGSITEEGKILGTVSYMSPEQAEGKPLDHRSDIFSFGVVLYEMATGRRPFQGDTAISTISSILKDTPRPAEEINASLPRHLGRIVRRCLAKEPERRFQSTEDLRNELVDLKEERDSGVLTQEMTPKRDAPKSIPGRTRKRAAWIAAALALPLVLVAAWLWTKQAKERPAARPGGPGAFRMSRATTDGKVFLAAISPEGRYVAYVRRDGSTQSLRLRQLVTGDEVQVVPATEGILLSPTFSGDGNYLHYVSIEPGHQAGALYRVSVLGGTPRRIVDGVKSASGSPDGSLIAFVAGGIEESFLRVAGPEGESPRDLLSRKGRDHFDSQPSWSSDGRSLAIVSHRYGEPQRIVLVDPATGSERFLETLPLRNFEFLTWMPGRDAIVVVGSERPVTQMASPQLWEVSTAGGITPITRDLNEYSSVSVTADGSVVAAVQDERSAGIEIAEVRDGVPVSFTELLPTSAARHGGAGIAWLSENRLALAAVQGEDWQVHVADVPGRTVRPLTSGAQHRDPASSDDGRTLVVVRGDQEKVGLWRVDPESGRAEKLTDGEFEGFPAVSPDGAWVVYSAIGEGFRLMKVPSKGGDPVELVKATIWCTGITKTGEALCVLLAPSGESTFVLLPLAGGPPRPIEGIPPRAEMARLAPDGRSITYLVSSEGASELWSLPLQGGEARRLSRLEGREIVDFAWSPGGSRIAVVKASRSGDVILLRRDLP